MMMMMKNAIKLSLQGGHWMATYLGPAGDQIFSLFGTVTIPTAFNSDASAEDVLSQLQASNPGAQVYLNEDF